MNWSFVADLGQSLIVFYFIFASATLYRSNKRQQELINRQTIWLEYAVDRLERVEPVPITILDGLGRDISHLNDEVTA